MFPSLCPRVIEFGCNGREETYFLEEAATRVIAAVTPIADVSKPSDYACLSLETSTRPMCIDVYVGAVVESSDLVACESECATRTLSNCPFGAAFTACHRAGAVDLCWTATARRCRSESNVRAFQLLELVFLNRVSPTWRTRDFF